MKVPVCVMLDSDLVEFTKGGGRSRLLNDLLRRHVMSLIPYSPDRLREVMSLKEELKPIIDVAKSKGITKQIIGRYKEQVERRGINISSREAHELLKEAVK
jgi:hypothetical protein